MILFWRHVALLALTRIPAAAFSHAFLSCRSSSRGGSCIQIYRTRQPRCLYARLEERDEERDEDLFDRSELDKRMERHMTQYYDLLASGNGSSMNRPELVHIVVFNPGSEDPDAQQGVHSIEFPKGSGKNILLAFESGDECIEFAKMLKDMQFYEPVPQTTELEQLEGFCRGIGVPVQVVPTGWGLTPPSDTVDDMAMNPNLGKDKQRLNRLLSFGESGDPRNDTDVGAGQWE